MAVACRFQLQFLRRVGLQPSCSCLAVDMDIGSASRARVLGWDLGYSSPYLLQLCWFKEPKHTTYVYILQGGPLHFPLQVYFPGLF